jgi:hypothetical protein
MRQEYRDFLARKAPRALAAGIEPGAMNPALFDFQRDVTAFCLRQGRAALFLDTGLGKTICELEFASQAARHTGKPALLLTWLSVARQIEREAFRFSYDARVIRDQSEALPGINICNYDRLDRIDPSAYGCVVLDESSVIKSFTGATTRRLIQDFQGVPFKLCATATPAPNDHMELGQHAEFLEVMASNEMLARWFISDQTQMGKYRLKHHGVDAFWDWMASWSRMAETPADLGYDASRFVLPPLHVHRHKAAGTVKIETDGLFAGPVSATNLHDLKRQTAESRADLVAGLVANEPDDAWVVWCDTDYEADALASRIPEAVEVRGSQTIEKKEAGLADFAEGRSRVIISKPSIAGFGCNWQHAARQAFVGRSFSYEAWYQAVRRSWRFGQQRPVHVHIAVAEGEDQIGRVIDRKASDHATMKRAMAQAMLRARETSSAVKIAYNPTHEGKLPKWL